MVTLVLYEIRKRWSLKEWHLFSIMGNTMWYNELTINPHKPTYAYPALPFTTNHDKQIKYVKTDVLSRIQVEAMKEAVIRCIDEVYGTKDTVSPERLNRMKTMMRERFDLLITALQKGR